MKTKIKVLSILAAFAVFSSSTVLNSSSEKLNTPEIEKVESEVLATSRDAIINSAMKKLSATERAAFISLLSDTNLYKSLKANKSQNSKIAKLRQHLAEMKDRFKPAKWLGPLGEEYDSYGEYLEGVWGVPYPSPTNPYNPF